MAVLKGEITFEIKLAGYTVGATHTRLNLFITVVIFVVVFIGSVCVDRGKGRSGRALFRALLAAYFYFILAVTLLSRTAAGTPQAKLVPLWSWMEVFKGNESSWYLQEIGLNVVLFIPFGVLLELNWKMPIVRALLIGLGVSCSVEVIQYFSCLGLFEWDDMIHNTLGCLIGAAAVSGYRGHRSRQINNTTQ